MEIQKVNSMIELAPCVNCGKELTDTVVCKTCQKHWSGTPEQLNVLIAMYEMITFKLPVSSKVK
jgi:hypothetical protein